MYFNTVDPHSKSALLLGVFGCIYASCQASVRKRSIAYKDPRCRFLKYIPAVHRASGALPRGARAGGAGPAALNEMSEESVAQFLAVTGDVGRVTAVRCLSQTSGNVERAIGLYFEQALSADAAAAAASSAAAGGSSGGGTGGGGSGGGGAAADAIDLTDDSADASAAQKRKKEQPQVQAQSQLPFGQQKAPAPAAAAAAEKAAAGSSPQKRARQTGLAFAGGGGGAAPANAAAAAAAAAQAAAAERAAVDAASDAEGVLLSSHVVMFPCHDTVL